MNKILIIGATGQLGTAVVRKLGQLNTYSYSLRIMIREDSSYDHLKDLNPEIVFGDLKNKEEIYRAVEGCDIIIATANSAAPRKKEDSFQRVDINGYRDLIDAAKEAGVKQFIYISANPGGGKYTRWVPLAQAKAATEAYLEKSGLTYTIFQPDNYMDVYLAFMGTSLPARNEAAALVHRAFPFMQNFYKGVKDDIEKGKIGIIGRGDVKRRYIAIENVADFVIASLENPKMYNQDFPIGGPQSLSPLEVKSIFEKVLGRKLKVKKTPRFMMKLLGNVFALFNEGASNIFKLNYMSATVPTTIDSDELAKSLGIRLISVEEYLRAKAGEPVLS